MTLCEQEQRDGAVVVTANPLDGFGDLGDAVDSQDAVNGTDQTFAPAIPGEQQAILDAIQNPDPHAPSE